MCTVQVAQEYGATTEQALVEKLTADLPAEDTHGFVVCLLDVRCGQLTRGHVVYALALLRSVSCTCESSTVSATPANNKQHLGHRTTSSVRIRV